MPLLEVQILFPDRPEFGDASSRFGERPCHRMAGLAKTPGVRPNSIPAWRGAAELANGASIDEVAVLLGMRSLDRAATFIGFDWRAAL